MSSILGKDKIDVIVAAVKEIEPDENSIKFQGHMFLRCYEGDKNKFVVLKSDSLLIFEKEEDFDPTEDQNTQGIS